MVFQIAVHDHAFDVAQVGGHTPFGITQVRARHRAARSELAHHAAQALGPVAGAKGLAVLGDALDKDLFGAGSGHG